MEEVLEVMTDDRIKGTPIAVCFGVGVEVENEGLEDARGRIGAIGWEGTLIDDEDDDEANI